MAGGGGRKEEGRRETNVGELTLTEPEFRVMGPALALGSYIYIYIYMRTEQIVS